MLSSQTLHWNSSGALHIPRVVTTTTQGCRTELQSSAGVCKGEMFAKTVFNKTSIKKNLLEPPKVCCLIKHMFKAIVMIYYPFHRCF